MSKMTRRITYAACALLAVFVFMTGASAQSVFDSMLQRLRSARPAERIAALRDLQRSGYPSLFDAVAPSLTDPDNAVQLEAMDTLLTVSLAPAPAPKQARPFSTANGSIAESVFDALPLDVLPRPVPAAVPAGLLAAVRDDDQRVRVAAAFTLGVLASPIMGPVDADTERRLESEYPYALRHPDPATREALVRAAARLFEPPPHGAAPVAISDAIIAAMNDEDARVRLWACDTLGWLRERRAGPALRQRLEYYRSGDEARAALHALARIAQPESASALRDSLRARQPETRVIAIEGLGRIRDAAAVPLVTHALDRGQPPKVLLAGAFAYYLLGERTNLDTLVSGLVHPDTARQARVYLTELGAAVAPDLRPYLQRSDPAVRQAVAEVLGLSGDAGSLAALEAAARDRDPAVGEAVRQALVRLRALPGGVRAH